MKAATYDHLPELMTDQAFHHVVDARSGPGYVEVEPFQFRRHDIEIQAGVDIDQIYQSSRFLPRKPLKTPGCIQPNDRAVDGLRKLLQSVAELGNGVQRRLEQQILVKGERLSAKQRQGAAQVAVDADVIRIEVYQDPSLGNQVPSSFLLR